MYTIEFHRSAERKIRKIAKRDKKTAERIADEIRPLKVNPRLPGTEHLTDNLYRIRSGDYRIIYAVFDIEEIVVIGKIARRNKSTYKNLKEIMSSTIAVYQQKK